MKGQDLMTNAKAKNVTSAANNWKALVYAYADRNGKFPGDPTRTGFIKANAVQQIYSTMSQAPTNPVSVGGQAFYFYMGTNNAVTPTKNVMVICTNSLCDQAFTTDDIELIKTIDTSIDGSSDPLVGNLRAATAITGLSPAAPAGYHADTTKYTAFFTGVTEDTVATWGTTATAALFYFDKSR